jgi:hypothetical protein
MTIKITVETIESIKVLLDETKTLKEISKILKLSVDTIKRTCKKHNIINPKFRKSKIVDGDIINVVLEMVGLNFTIQNIAEKIGYSKKSVIKLYRELKLNINPGRAPLPIPTEKLCKYNDGRGCGLVKPVSEFRMRTEKRDSGNIYTKPENYCRECSIRNANERSRKHYENNIQYYHDRNQANKSKNNESRKKREKKDPSLKLRNRISRSILKQLKNNNGSKNGKSITDFLPYQIEELRVHIEKQWKNPGNEWMTWDNHGSYKLGGEKKWHIDHIITHSHFKYATMDCDEFLNCWALSNLRPLEATENIKKGNKITDIAEQLMHNQT